MRKEGDLLSGAWRFQFLFCRCEDPFERRSGFVHGHLAHDASFQSGKAGLLRPFDGYDVEAGALRISDADREIECRLEVVGCVNLFLNYCIGRARWGCSAIYDPLDDPKCRLQSKINFLPVKASLHFIGLSLRIFEKIFVEFGR